MSGTTKLLIAGALLLLTHLANAQTSGKIQVIENPEISGAALLVRTNTYAEAMPDTAYITARRAAIKTAIDSLNAEIVVLNALQDAWEAIVPVAPEVLRVGSPSLHIAPGNAEPFNLMFTQGRKADAYTFQYFTRTGATAFMLELKDNGQVWVNNKRWIYSKTKKRFYEQ